MFDIIVAADRAWGIGKDNGMPWPRLREDLAHFKRVTSATIAGKRNVIVMGRKTWTSKEIGGRPLPKRLNMIITRGPALAVPEGVVVTSSLADALTIAATSADIESTFVIGGGEIYRAAIAYDALRWIYLTRVDGDFACDTRIPDLDRTFAPVEWDGARELEEAGVRYRVEKLARRATT